MIHAKLLEFQKLNITVEKDGKNPHFNSEYTTLDEVLSKVKGPLNNLNVVIVQAPGYRTETNADMEYGLFTRLIDTEDDSFIEGFVPYLEATNAQKLGSNLTYARRYSLIAMLGLGDDDDDGNAASAPKAAAKTPYKAPVRATSPVQRDDEPFPSKAPAATSTASTEPPADTDEDTLVFIPD